MNLVPSHCSQNPHDFTNTTLFYNNVILIPIVLKIVFLILFVLWSSNCDWNFDTKILKLLMLIDLFITNIKM